jgi:hypothetical protein
MWLNIYIEENIWTECQFSSESLVFHLATCNVNIKISETIIFMFFMGVKLDFLDLEGAGREGVEWIYLAQNESTKRLLWTRLWTCISITCGNYLDQPRNQWFLKEKIWTMEFFWLTGSISTKVFVDIRIVLKVSILCLRLPVAMKMKHSI